MAEVKLQYGDDEQSKAMAQQIIHAQDSEIEEASSKGRGRRSLKLWRPI